MEAIGDVHVGRKIKSQRRTISEGEFTAMVNLSWESGPLHSDREYAKTTVFGERVLGGPCIIPFVAGLSGRAWHGMWEEAGAQILALVGIENVRFMAPLFPGDTIWVEIEVVGFRRTSKPERFITTVKDVLYKQDGSTILEMERLVLMQERGREDSKGSAES
jgi:acyl dehydratase